MSSLNEGFELDDEISEKSSSLEAIDASGSELVSITPSDFSKVVFDETTPGKVPELSDDASVVTMVNKVEDLNDLKTSLINTSGMSKKFALEAEQLIPGFINDNNPISFYTEFPSKTNYKLALEAITKEQKKLVDGIKQAVTKLSQKTTSMSDTVSLESKDNVIDIDNIIKSYSDKNLCTVLKRVQKILLNF